MKRLIVGLTAAVVMSLGLGSALAQDKFMTIGTAGTAGALYPMGVAMAETVNRHVPGVRASAAATGGSLDNVRNLSTGTHDWAISANEVAYQAYHGEGPYEGRAVDSLRSLFGTVTSWAQIFALADSPLDSVADFKGKRIGVGPPGSGGEQTARRLLAHYGLTYDDITAEFMTNAGMVSALQDGVLDAFVITHPLRSAPLIDLTTRSRVKLISVEDGSFYEAHPYFAKSEIPAGTYENVDAPVMTPTSRIVMYATTESPLSDEQVYLMLKAIWENRGEWGDVHAAVKKSTTLEDALVGLDGIPLHPGALRYYKERGFEIPDSMMK